MKNLNKYYEKLSIIAIDININNRINRKYNNTDIISNISESDDFLNIIEEYRDIDSAMKKIKELRFIETYIIVSEKVFHDFVIAFNNNLKDIYIIPKIIIFSKNNNQLLLPDNIKNKLFYTFFGVRTSIEEIKEFIDSQKELETINYNEIPQAIPKSNELIFQRILKKNDYNLPLVYKILLDVSETKDEKFIEIIKKYKNEQNYKSLINPIITIPDIPIELLSKYYIRMYTVEGNIYRKMNFDLLKDYNKDNIIYQSYIKTLYEGVEKKSLKTINSFEGLNLYGSQYFTDEQIYELNEYSKQKIEYYKYPIIFSKRFLSFSKDKSIAEHCFKYRRYTMLIIVGAKNEFNLDTHADIEELSYFPSEREVLFFPFSAFGIEDFIIDVNNNMNIIKLIYLGRFLKDYELNKKFDIMTSKLPNNDFKDLFRKTGLIEDEKLEQMKVKSNFNYEKRKSSDYCCFLI